jgi:hypothetical protein
MDIKRCKVIELLPIMTFLIDVLFFQDMEFTSMVQLNDVQCRWSCYYCSWVLSRDMGASQGRGGC